MARRMLGTKDVGLSYVILANQDVKIGEIQQNVPEVPEIVHIDLRYLHHYLQRSLIAQLPTSVSARPGHSEGLYFCPLRPARRPLGPR